MNQIMENAEFIGIRATFYEQKHESGNSTWKVKKGKRPDGKFVYQNCKSEEEARAVANEWNATLVTNDQGALQHLNNLMRHEIGAGLARLKMFDANATFTNVVDFYIKHSCPPKGKITLKEAFNIFIESLELEKRSAAYIKGCKKTYMGPFCNAFPPAKLLNEVTEADAKSYINSHRTSWADKTRQSHITYLRTFFNFHIKEKFATLNPFAQIKVPKLQACNPKIIPWQSAKSLLQFALDTNRLEECACMALVFFCGVRVQEVGRLTWDSIDFETKEVTIEWHEAKSRRRRTNPISPNALEWLKICKGRGSIAPRDYDQRIASKRC